MKKKTIKDLKALDQFFTNPEVSKICIGITNQYYSKIRRLLKNKIWMEPSAGNGDFYFNFPVSYDRFALDIDKPKNIKDDRYKQGNFLELDTIPMDTAIVGNPPFGKLGKLAFDFITKSMELKPSLIAFIVPKSVNTAARRKIVDDMGYVIIHKNDLDSDSFYLDTGETKVTSHVESIFQIYMRKDLFNQVEEIEEYVEIKLKNTEDTQVYMINSNVIKNKSRDTEGKEFIQYGVGTDWIGKCDFYLPLRIFNSDEKVEIYNEFNKETMSNLGFGIIDIDKELKNKIDPLRCYNVSTQNVKMASKQLILKEIDRIKKLNK